MSSAGRNAEGSRSARVRREERFAVELSHELRTPLARIYAESDLALRRARSPEEYIAALEVVRRSAEQMTRTVNTLLAAARGEPQLVLATADAGAATAAAVAGCWQLAAERGIAIEIDVPSAPLLVGLDGGLVERIVQPLIENACHYGRSRIRVSLGQVDSHVVLTLEDDGPGVAADERERIFEAGMRGSASGAGADQSGAGLGLALSRRLARAAGGDVCIGASARGAKFLVRLPAP